MALPRGAPIGTHTHSKRCCFAVLFKGCVMMTIMLDITSDSVFFLLCMCVCVCVHSCLFLCTCTFVFVCFSDADGV